MLRRLVIFLIRKKLGVKKYEEFRFSTQKSPAVYFFTEYNLMKIEHGNTMLSGVSLNWLLDIHCEIRILGGDGQCQ